MFNFGVVSSFVFGVAKLLVSTNAIPKGLGDGLVLCASLPVCVNVVIVLTATIGGDEAAAVLNTVLGNFIGIFLSPALILGYLGTSTGIDLPKVFFKLTLCVILPYALGQVLQKTSEVIREFAAKHKKHLKKIQEYCLVYILYCVFCQTFSSNESRPGLANVFLMVFVVLVVMVALMVLAWYSLKIAFPNEPGLRVMGVFGCTEKTVSWNTASLTDSLLNSH